MLRPAALLFALALLVPAARAQPSPLALGAQVSTLGVGVSGSYRLTRLVSVSAEANLLPVREVQYEADGITYDSDVQVRGSVLLVNLHPFGGKFSVGGGLLLGGYEVDGVATPTEPIEVGGDTYTPAEIGSVEGFGSVSGPVPVVVVGWRGHGFNFGVGVTTGYTSEVRLGVTGPNADRPDVRENVARERQNVEDAIREVPVIPYLRLGWQFGL